MILACPQIETLKLRSIDASLDLHSLEKLNQLTQLKDLQLEGIPVEDSWLEKMVSLKKLESINLVDTDVGGRGFQAFADHPHLRKVKNFSLAYPT